MPCPACGLRLSEESEVRGMDQIIHGEEGSIFELE